MSRRECRPPLHHEAGYTGTYSARAARRGQVTLDVPRHSPVVPVATMTSVLHDMPLGRQAEGYRACIKQKPERCTESSCENCPT